MLETTWKTYSFSYFYKLIQNKVILASHKL